MAKNNITQFDATDANNTDIKSIDISEGMAPSNVNNALRALMATLADLNAGTTTLTSPSGVNITATTAIKTPAIQFTDGDAAITIADGGGVTANNFSSSGVNIDGGAIDGITLGTNSAVTQAVIDNINIDGTTIGHTSDTDLLTLTSGLLTVAGEVSMTTLDLGGTNVTATATEINIIDGDATVGTTTPVAGDGIVTNDNGTMRQTSVDTFDTYLSQSTKTLTNKTIDADNNTVSNLEVDNLKSGVLDTDLSSVSSSHDTIPSAKATKEFLEASGTAAANSATASATSATASQTAQAAAETAQAAAASSATAASTSESNSQTSANSAAASALLAAGAFDSFDDKYLGTMADSDTASSASTTGTFSSGGSQITVASASGIEVGQLITGTNIATGTNVIKIDGTTINISEATTGAGSGTSLTFTGHGVFGDFNSSIDGCSTDNDGNTLVTGMLYFNTTDGEMRVYDGANWIAASASGSVSFTKYKYVATASQTTFSGTDANSATLSYVTNNIIVALNGVILDATDFTATNGTSVVLGSGAAASDELTIYAFKSFTVADAVAASTGGTFGGNVVFSGTTTGLDLNGTELILDADGDTSITADTDDQIDIKIGGSDRVTIDSSGNVGIATTSPDADLTIPSPSFGSGGTGNGIRFQNTNNDADAIIQSYYSGTSASALLHGQNLYLATNASFTNFDSSKGSSYILQNTDGQILFGNASSSAPSERMRIDSSGNLLVGTTNSDIRSSSSLDGMVYRTGVSLDVSRDGGVTMNLNRLSSDGAVMQFRKDGSTVGSIDSSSSNLLIRTTGNKSGLRFDTNAYTPFKNGSASDDEIDLGFGSGKFRDIYAGNASIQTSDENEKQDIAIFTAKEINIAKKLLALFKTFRWKTAVSEKGDNARTHSGIIAQEIQSAFNSEGLDVSKYGLFISNTWWEENETFTDDDGKEATRRVVYHTEKEATSTATKKTRLGVRYPELFSFIFSSIEARLTALEAK